MQAFIRIETFHLNLFECLTLPLNVEAAPAK